MIEMKDLYTTYEQYGKRFSMTPVSISRNHVFGDAGFVKIEFLVDIYDIDEHVSCMSVNYNYYTTSFVSEVRVDSHLVYDSYRNCMLERHGGYTEPCPTEDKNIIIPLLNKFADYLQISHIVQVENKTQFSSESHTYV